MKKQDFPPDEDEKTIEAAVELSINERPALLLDVDKFQSYLDDSDWSEEEKKSFLEALWSIIVSFVDLGYGVHPLQQTAPDRVCGRNCEKNDQKLAFESAAMIKSAQQSTKKQTIQSGDPSRRERKES